MPSSGAAPLALMAGIVKRFGDNVALASVDLDLRAGQVHALLGENGAGKSTLMNILSGVVSPDAGEIRIDGRPVRVRSPRSATALGIGMVHQQYRLLPTLTVAENVHLGWERTPRLISRRLLRARTSALADRFGIEVSPDARIFQLPVGVQQRVAILRALVRGARILILDEPTSVLTPLEAEQLFRSVRTMAAEGTAVVFISHKLGEVLAVSDRVTVLRGGRVIGSQPTSECTEASLARQMIGRDTVLRAERDAVTPGPLVLEATGLHVADDRGHPAVRGLDLTVRAGEIVGIAGVAGNGQLELAEALSGMRRTTAGTIRVDPGAVGHVPEDRDNVGLIPADTLEANAILRAVRHPPLHRRGLLRRAEASAHARRVVSAARLTTDDVASRVDELSGGNRQRLLVARELDMRHSVLIVSHPTAGVDIGATAAIWAALLDARRGGKGLLLLSEDLNEILALSDRVLVIFNGRIVGEFTGEQIDRDRIGMLMGGSRRLGDVA